MNVFLKSSKSSKFVALWNLLLQRLAAANGEFRATEDPVLRAFWKLTINQTLDQLRAFDDYRYSDICVEYGFFTTV